MSQLFATLFPDQYVPPSGTMSKSHKAIPQKEEQKLTPNVIEAIKAKSGKEKEEIVESLTRNGFSTASIIAKDVGMSVLQVANHLKVLTRKNIAVRYESAKQPAIYGLV